ncbi:hypothetical protein PUNSTDRAFT_142090 [Punctularia strigosozonata HHB-11173 SS5]|uniref:uncharacterized protein n=1 Tax=Punctularia strigosozonata (strain HHB-11173) TaxID=741275 RepID=UPI0004417BC6|nr:uncharacterized protein PUNSTDRAFT_142090 [Punctularia strigosozonata HHB-11173 SS5]EIN11867.1 hypothetical protein PUNSTDRAFT_142090 [Punctularia strigosozonata HHB-11173 SS5]
MSFNRNHVSSTTSTPANIREMNIGIPKKLKAEYTIRARREDSALPAASGPVTRPHRVPGSSGRPTDRATRQSAATLESLDLAVELAPPPVPARTAMIRYGGTGLQGTGYLAEATAVRSRNPRPDDGPFKVVVVDQANRISQTVSVHSQFPGSPVNQAAGACQPPPVPSPSGSPTSWDWPRPPTHMPPSVHAIVNTRVSPSSSDRSRRIHSPEQSLDKMQRRIELGLGADIKRGAPHVNKGNGRAVREKNRDGIVYHQIPDIARTREPAATYHGSTHRMRPSLPIGPLVANSMGVKARSQSRSPLAPVVPVHGTSALHTQTRSPMHAPSAPSHKIREKPVPVPFQPHQPEKLPAAPQPFKVPSQMEHKGVQNTRAMLPGWRA